MGLNFSKLSPKDGATRQNLIALLGMELKIPELIQGLDFVLQHNVPSEEETELIGKIQEKTRCTGKARVQFKFLPQVHAFQQWTKLHWQVIFLPDTPHKEHLQAWIQALKGDLYSSLWGAYGLTGRALVFDGTRTDGFHQSMEQNPSEEILALWEAIMELWLLIVQVNKQPLVACKYELHRLRQS